MTYTLTYHLRCRDCAVVEPRAEWVGGFRCDACWLKSATTKSPEYFAGYWSGCLDRPDASMVDDAYWDGFVKAQRVVLRRQVGSVALRVEAMRMHPDMGNEALEKFESQRRSARSRGVGWEMSFDEWCAIWKESGHWSERGRAGYVMCRKGDEGQYAVGNVFIATASENVRGYREKIGSPGQLLCGFGEQGYTLRKRKRGFVYEVTLRGAYIGTFKTADAAVAEYRAAALRDLQDRKIIPPQPSTIAKPIPKGRQRVLSLLVGGR